MKKELFLCSKKDLFNKKKIIKFYEELKDEVIIFLDDNNEIKIFSSICPHFGGEIYFDSNEKILKCKWHGWKFSKDNGQCLTHPIKGKLNVYDFEVNPGNLNKYLYSEDNKNIFILYD